MRISILATMAVAAFAAVGSGACQERRLPASGSAVSKLGQSAQTLVGDAAPPSPHSYIELQREDFRSVIDGKSTDLYTIRSPRGMFAKITNLGAKIEQIVVPDRNGRFGDVVLGYQNITSVKDGQASMGAFLGRYANRIGGGAFSLDGVEYRLALNEAAPKNNTVHGGAKGGRFRVYDATQLSEASVKMTLTYLDAEDADPAQGITGFPGTLAVTVVYTVTEGNELVIEYNAQALDKKTIVNLTTHPFFNLSNSPASTTLDHIMRIHADKVIELNDRSLPTGAMRDVAGTPMDFRSPKRLGRDYQAPYDLLQRVGGGGAGVAGGYDNTFVLNQPAKGELALAASVCEPDSGRWMDVWSTEPGLHFFSGQNLIGQTPRDVGKGGVVYQKYFGFALEPMRFPDSPNQPAFPSTTLGPRETYAGKTVFKFKVEPRGRCAP